MSAFSEQTLPPADIAPAIHLPADLPVDADRREAAGFVQGNAGRVGQGNAGKDGVNALVAQQGEARFVE